MDFFCLTDKRQPNAPTDTSPALRCTPRLEEVNSRWRKPGRRSLW